ncbi:MAG: NTP transferase domain-containing protein [Candidatus Marinimicrobia bacterium]|nr:NTP transferase domain-containing protein [Candidatus Neomarinimicrobiota bacterium]
MQAVIPAAGFGTRFLPWSKAVPKEMLPVGALPVIHHVAAEAVAAGCTKIVIVLAQGKEAIKRYFDPDPALEAHLQAKDQGQLLDALRRLQEAATFEYVYQPVMRGLGDAVRCGAEQLAGLPFAVLLGDTIIRGASPLRAMWADCRATGLGSVAVQPVAAERAVRYGVCGGRETAPQVYALEQMVEKPPAEAVPGMRLLDGRTVHMAFAARYVLPAEITAVLAATPAGRNNEIQLTDAMAELLRTRGFHAHLLTGTRLDIGTPEGLKSCW